MLSTLYVPLVFLAALVSICLAVFAWVHRDRPGAESLVAFALAAGLWAVAEGMTVARRDEVTMEFWAQVSLTLSVVIPVAWLVLVLDYTRTEQRSRRTLWLLLVEPVVFVALIWTNARHGYVWSRAETTLFRGVDALELTFGLGFWGHQVYASLLFTAGAALVVTFLFRSDHREQWLGTALLGAVSLPVAGNVLFAFGLFPAGLNPTAMASVVAACLLAAVLFVAELHSAAPITREIGRETVLEELDDAVLILDDSDHIVDINPAGTQLVGEPRKETLGRPVSTALPGVDGILEPTSNRTEVELDHDGKRRYYDVRIVPLSRGYGAFSGTLVSLRDVSERRQREQRLAVLHRLLRHNVRNELNLVRGRIELAEVNVEDDAVSDRLTGAVDAVDALVARSNKVGRLSRLLDAENEDSNQDEIDLATELRKQQQTGEFGPPSGEVQVELPTELPVAGGTSLLAAFEELVSNGIEHNDSEHPRVTLSVDETRSSETHVVIAVSDNGPGIGDQEWQTIADGHETPLHHSSGIGLWLVNWVVNRAGGTLAFDNDDGTTVRVRLPRKQ